MYKYGSFQSLSFTLISMITAWYLVVCLLQRFLNEAQDETRAGLTQQAVRKKEICTNFFERSSHALSYNLLLSFSGTVKAPLIFFETFPYQVSFLCHARLLGYNKARVTNFFQQWRKTCDYGMRDLVFSQPQSGIPG